ncbi:hypothetical protein GQ42DRAFT_164523, partial [Ramicandelaber brevisporus]
MPALFKQHENRTLELAYFGSFATEQTIIQPDSHLLSSGTTPAVLACFRNTHNPGHYDSNHAEVVLDVSTARYAITHGCVAGERGDYIQPRGEYEPVVLTRAILANLIEKAKAQYKEWDLTPRVYIPPILGAHAWLRSSNDAVNSSTVNEDHEEDDDNDDVLAKCQAEIAAVFVEHGCDAGSISLDADIYLMEYTRTADNNNRNHNNNCSLLSGKSSGYVVRRATHDDIAGIAAVSSRAYGWVERTGDDSWIAPKVSAMINDPLSRHFEVVVTPADTPAEVVCNVSLFRTAALPHHLSVSSVATHPDHQRKGLASAALRYALTAFASHGENIEQNEDEDDKDESTAESNQHVRVQLLTFEPYVRHLYRSVGFEDVAAIALIEGSFASSS